MSGLRSSCCVVFVPDNHRSLGYVFGETINNSGFSGQNFNNFMFWYVFGIGLLMSQYTITGFDASAHIAEETNESASRTAASESDVRSPTR